MRILEAVRRANRPGPPENSLRFRLACTLTVLIGVVAIAAEGEVARTTAFIACVLVAAGMVFSYRTRNHPPAWVKVVVATAAVSVLFWFFSQLTAQQVSSFTEVEDPLAVMFIAIQAIHSFHVPSRRDLLFSLGASAALLALAGAQAIDSSFGLYAIGWIVLSLWALFELWISASDGGRVSVGTGIWTVGAVLLTGAIVFVLLPAPGVSIRFSFQLNPGSAGAVPIAGALAGDSNGKPSELSKPGTPAGATRVGGFLGFANTLDTALRGQLSQTLVMRVRAQRPTYWVGETFDEWNGQSWVATTSTSHKLDQGSPFSVPITVGDTGEGASDLQTFYIATSTPDLIFHADEATQVWFPAKSVFYGEDGTLVSPIGLGRGAIYTVESQVDSPTPDALRQDLGSETLPPALERDYTHLPYAYPQVAALTRSVTKGAPDTYDKVQALINWIGANTHYSTDIPPLPPGADTVNEFLFGNRVGFCEQISTSLAVMLRTLGIPAREVVGYVPGNYDPVTDLYQVHADDAHAWVQVWFPGYGWQSFDPTAAVPLANPSPGGTALRDVGHALSRVPWIPVGSVIAAMAMAYVVLRWRRSQPATWDEVVVRSMERAGKRSGRARLPAETIREYGIALGSPEWEQLAGRVAEAVYGERPPAPQEERELVATARRLSRRE